MKTDFNVDDIIKYTGKSINSVTKNKEYIIIRKETFEFTAHNSILNKVIYLDDNKREKSIMLNNTNQWQKKFEYVSNLRKEKIKKLNSYESSC